MMKLVAAACLVATLLIASSSLVAAECTHDSDIALLEGERRDLARPAPPNIPVEREGRANGFDAIRIVFSTRDLDDASKYCTSASGSVGDFKGGTIACDADSVFTAEKKAELLNVVLPHARNLLQAALQVRTLTTKLVVGSTSQCSGGFTIPAEHVSEGVAGADFVLYVGAAPTSGSTVAWAATCQSDGLLPKRALVGRANFSPKYINSPTFAKELLKSTGVHEILHALGFSSGSFSEAGITSTHTVRGISKTFVSSGTAKRAARDYIGCQSLPGVEIENEGGSGSAGSHVDRRIFKEDVMAATSGRALSVITLSMMKDLGVYDVNWTAAENMIVGKHEGCGYAEDSSWCNTDTRNFCTTAGTVGCSSDLRGYGPCRTGSDAIFTDGCGYVASYSNRQCDDRANSDDPTGNTFHPDSRCVVTSDLFSDGADTSTIPERCMRARCIGGILSFNTGSSSWATCTTSGASISGPTGTTGKIICPNITRYCDSLQYSHNGSSLFGPLPPAEPVATGKSNRAATYVYTAKSILFLNGVGWAAIIKNKFSELLIAISLDVAQYLGLEAQQVWLRGVDSGSNYVRFTLSINDPSRTAEQVQAKWEDAINGGGRNWMPRTAGLYEAHSASADTPVLASASTDPKPTNLCADYMPEVAEDVHLCNGMIAGLVFVVLALIALVVFTIYKCCCQYKEPPTDWKYMIPQTAEPKA